MLSQPPKVAVAIVDHLAIGFLNFSSMAAFLFLRLRFCRVDDCISCIDISQPAQRCQETLLLPLIFSKDTHFSR